MILDKYVSVGKTFLVKWGDMYESAFVNIETEMDLKIYKF
jgi:hypothetical protein